MRRNKRVLKRLLCIIIVSIFLTGCVKSYRVDFIKTYNNYLKYSLGEYEYDKQNEQSSPGPIPQVSKYLVWNIKYKDSEGKDKNFVINNVYDKDMNVRMAQQVYRQASGVCSDEIGTNVCSKYFDYISDKNKVSEENLPVTYVLVNGDYYTDRSKSFYNNCIDRKHGIKLSSIKAKEFKEKWDCNFNMKIVTAEIKDQVRLDEILSKVKAMLKDYSEYLNLDSATASVNYSEFDQLYKITYDRKNSRYDVENMLEKQGKNITSLSSQELIDGHVKYISTYIVNGKQLAWLDKAQYDKETKTYYLGSYYNLLKALGIEFEKFDRRVGTADFKWKIGGDTFEAYMNYPEKIIKNNIEFVRPKYSSPSNGLTSKEFEAISNTTVVIDEKNEAVIINSK